MHWEKPNTLADFSVPVGVNQKCETFTLKKKVHGIKFVFSIRLPKQ